MFRKVIVCLLFLVFLSDIVLVGLKGVLGGFSVAGDIWVPGDYGTIQEAINAAAENSVVRVNASVYNEHVVINKSISLIGENRETTIINGSGSGNVVLVKANHVFVSGFTIQHGDSGFFVDSVINCTIKGNIVKNNNNGIFLYHSWNCLIQENNVTNNVNRGIFLTFSGNSMVVENNVVNNGWYGINFNVSRNCVATRNVVKNHTVWDGLGLQSATECILTLNSVYNNFRGVWVNSANSNIIYHNNFFNNDYQARVTPDSYGNVWDAGYPGGGNYWSDYVGVDRSSGLYQNETGSDAIGDRPYTKEANDRYPLIKPINFFNLGVWNNQAYFATTVSNSTTIDNFSFSVEEKRISFNVTGRDNTKGFCRVGIPKDVLWVGKVEDWRVLLDDVEDITVNCRFYVDDEFTYVYIPYNHTSHVIHVIGTYAIPELSMPTIFLLLMPFVLAAAVVFKKRRNCRFVKRAKCGKALVF